MKLPVYLDNHSTTPCDPRVVEAMLPWFHERPGNPANRHHRYGYEAEDAVQRAREETASLIGARPVEIVFTGGATESNNLALKGALRAARDRGNHLVTCITEHSSVRETCEWLEREGVEVTSLPVDSRGRIDPDDVRRSIREETVLVSVMAANNEIGVVAPLSEIGAVAREAGVLFHTDAAQAAGKIPLDVEAMRIDLLSISAHKMYGPKGVGALYVRRRSPRVFLEPLLHGGGQERGMRSGTLAVPGIVGLGKACSLAKEEMESESARVGALRDRLCEKIIAELDRVHQNGDPDRSLPNNLSLTFEFVEAEALLMELEDVALSAASACSMGTFEPSPVLLAIGLDVEKAQSTIRFGLGRFNTEEEIDYVAERIIRTVRRLRSGSPLYPGNG